MIPHARTAPRLRPNDGTPVTPRVGNAVQKVYNDRMDTFPQTSARRRRSRARDHVENIRIRKGESIVVGHRNQQYPEFVWCAAEDGHARLGARAVPPDGHGPEAVALRDYDAAQLTVVAGELLEALEQHRRAGSAAATPPAHGLGAVESSRRPGRIEP